MSSKYEKEAVVLRSQLSARAVAVFVIDGTRGTGASMAALDTEASKALAYCLRMLADEIDKDHTVGLVKKVYDA